MLEFEEYKGKLNALKPTLEVLRGALKLEAAQKEIEELEAASEREGFWNDVANSQRVQKRLKVLKAKVEGFQKLCAAWDDMYTLCEMALEEGDDSMLEELQSEFEDFTEKAESMRLGTLLSGEYDANNAILTFHAGAGGTEAQDWASMLYRMYNMWADRHGYKVKVMDYLDGDEAGLKSATILIEGENAYGFLRSEHGVHRLVRVSPFDAAGRRHTSFAAVEVMPEISADDTEIELKDDDIEMQVYRSSGAGGQKVNKTSSAVRLIHKPTGIVVSSQVERSHFQNLENCKNQGARAPREDQRHQGRADEDRMGQPDPLLRVHALPAREGSAHRVRDRQHLRRHGRRPRRLHQRVFVDESGELKFGIRNSELTKKQHH